MNFGGPQSRSACSGDTVQGINVQLSLSTPWRCIAGVKLQLHSFLTWRFSGAEGQLQATGNLFQRKAPPHAFSRGPGGPQSRPGHLKTKPNLLPKPKTEPRIVQPLASSLNRLRYPGSCRIGLHWEIMRPCFVRYSMCCNNMVEQRKISH
jgi:hypothetical protein